MPASTATILPRGVRNVLIPKTNAATSSAPTAATQPNQITLINQIDVESDGIHERLSLVSCL